MLALVTLIAGPYAWSASRPARIAWVAADGLRGDSVYVGPGAHSLDVAAARRLIGNRPIAVAEFTPRTQNTVWSYDLCRRIAGHLPRTVVLVVEGSVIEGGCAGQGWPAHEPGGDAQEWVDSLARDASSGARSQATLLGDATPTVAAFVADYDNMLQFDKITVPPRVASHGVRYRVLVSLWAVAGFLAAVALFLLDRLLIRWLGVWSARRHLRLAARAAAQAEVSRLAGLLLDVSAGDSARGAHQIADAAEAYAQAVAAFEHGRSEADFERAAALATTGIEAASRARQTLQRGR